jgi:DNA transformation protein
MSDLKSLKNLGNTIITNLNKIGIGSRRDLERIGAAGVYQELCNRYPDKTWPVCYYLYSIEGALTNKHWDEIGEKNKKRLLKLVGK